jgi:hypothetical protein
MLRRLAAFVALLSPVVAFASVEPYPASFQTRIGDWADDTGART